MTGWREDVQKLINNIRDIAKNPKSHFSYVKDTKNIIKEALLGKIAIYLKNLFPVNEDFIAIKREEGKIKVAGFRHEEVAFNVSLIMEKIRAYDFPDSWEEILIMIEG